MSGHSSSMDAVTRAAYRWNTAAGILSAFQSVVMLAVLSRVCSIEIAGVFSLAYANANLFLNLGKYGVRNYQVSDYPASLEFSAYLKARIITTAAMLIVGGGYLGLSAIMLKYDQEKVFAIVLMLLFKTVDSLEDVFIGNYQQHGRLDVGMRFLTVRLGTSMMLFCILATLTNNLIAALTGITVFSFVYLIFEVSTIWRVYSLPRQDVGRGTSWVRILRECFPLFLSTFLLFFISNAPKYAIDANLNDGLQAIYGYISMPVFVVNLLSTFIYNPILILLVKKWSEGKIKEFVYTFIRQLIIILGITIACDLMAWEFGGPVLGALYNTDLSPYRLDLIVLISGGGLMAIASLFTLGVTIIRWQASLSWGYLFVSIISALLSFALVSPYAIEGAVAAYALSMFVLAAWFGVTFGIGVCRKTR